jgi:hypothetical protein
MNPAVELHLALILFLPWFGVLAALFWLFPAAPRRRWRRRFDALAVSVAFVVSIAAMRHGYLGADAGASPIWRQVLAALYAYGGFLGALLVAAILRRRLAASG